MSLIGVDIGTSGCKVAVYTETGDMLSFASSSYTLQQPGPGLFELDSEQVLREVFSAIRHAVEEAKFQSRYKMSPIVAISFGSCSETVVPISFDGKILGPSILGYDERGDQAIEPFYKFGQQKFYRINPNILNFTYTYPKLVWYKESVPELYAHVWKFLNWSDFLTYYLTGKAATTYSHANRTLLFDLWKEDWSQELLGIGGIERRILADTVPAGYPIGKIKPDIASFLGLSNSVLVVTGGHDQCMNALGAGAIAEGSSVTGIGTVECTTLVFDSIPDPNMMLSLNLNIEHHVIPGKYVTLIYNQAGSLQRWFIKTFAQDLIMKGLDEREILQYLTKETSKDPSGLVFLPFIEPSGAPTFFRGNNGGFLGIGTDISRGSLYRSLLEGESMYFLETFEKLQRYGFSLTDIRATGGGSNSNLWLQIKADIYRRTVYRTRFRESGTVGAAILAGASAGIYKSVEDAVMAFTGTDDTFIPEGTSAEKYQDLYRLYQVGTAFIMSANKKE